MNDICRLCLCNIPTLKQKLFENEELLQRTSSCLQIEMTKNQLLPDQVCSSCTDKVDQFYNFKNKVKHNQQLLTHHLELGKKSLETFYSNLNVIIKEEKETIEKQELVTVEVTFEREDDIKSEKSDLNDNFDSSSDDDIIINRQANKKVQKRITKKRPLQNRGKVLKKKVVKKVVCKKFKAEENIQTASENTANEIKPENQENNEDVDDKDSDIQENKETADEQFNESFKCLTCFELFDSNRSLRGHYQAKHQPPTEKIKDEELFTKIDKKYKCNKCERTFPRIGEMRRHATYKHTDSRPYLCKICAKAFKDLNAIILHARAHGGGVRLACSFKCGYTTVYKTNLSDHETRVHKNDYKYKCETCGKGFIVKRWYEEHQNTHTGAKPFVCDICGAAYSFNKYLAHHRSIAHHDTSDVKRFNCLHCGHPCDCKNALKEHLAKKHGMKTGVASLSFLCNICGKNFNRYTTFKAHEKTHTDAKPHHCSLCKKWFKTAQILKSHQKVHAKAKNYVCLKCVKGYSTEIALNRHNSRQHKA